MYNPWVINNTEDKNSLDTSTNLTLDTEATFEDNFEPPISDSLPDSKEYLETLEKKLRVLKKDSNTINQLAAKREACLESLLRGSIDLTTANDLGLDEVVSFGGTRASELVRQIIPEQALTVGELVHIINHDHLDKNLEEGPNQNHTG